MELVRDKVITTKYLNGNLLDMFHDGTLRLNHPLQRYSDLWDTPFRDGFIATIIKGEDFDSIKLCEQLTDKGVVIWLIDGLQRLSTIDQFRHGLFRLGTKIEFPVVAYQRTRRDAVGEIIMGEDGSPEYEVCEFDLRGKTFNDLPHELQMKFDNYEISVVKHLDCTDEEVAYHIRRYNHQRAMNGNQTSMTYTDRCAPFIKDVSQNSRFFRDCGKYTQSEKKNGTWERIVMECDMAIFHLEDWQKQSKKMGQYISEHSTKEEFDTIRNYLSRLEVALGGMLFPDIFNSKNTFIWLAAFDRFTKFKPCPADYMFVDFIEAFQAGLKNQPIDGESFAEIDETRATKDKSVVIHKITFLEKLMRDYFYISEDEKPLPDLNEIEQFISENVGIDLNTVKEDMDLYKASLDSFKDNMIRIDSALCNRANEESLLAMVAYSYKNDVDIDEWLGMYAETHDYYEKDQTENFRLMLEDFERYLEEEKKSA